MARRRPGRLQRIAAWFARADSEPASRRDREDWAPGDMAQNVAASCWFDLSGAPSPGPAKGDVYRVVEVRLTINPRSGGYDRFLLLSHFGERLYVARHFRKVTPRADAARAADAAFAETLRPTPAPALPLPLVARLKRILS
jgi:hypothetical protein